MESLTKLKNKLFTAPVIVSVFALAIIFFLLSVFSSEPVIRREIVNGQETLNWLFLGIRVEFILFGLTLVCVALFHHAVLLVALTGLASILTYKFIFTDFNLVHHMFGGTHPIWSEMVNKEYREGEWAILLNLLGLLLGFAILAKHFEESHVPDLLPKWLPKGMMGGFILLLIVFILSSFLDNIAAAMIGGTIALVVFKKDVHIGFIAAIVAASNAGGAGSVVGDTTTTMMWIDGVAATDILHAYGAAIPAFLVFAFIAARQQDNYRPLVPTDVTGMKIIWSKLFIVALILAGTITTNVLFDFPALGVWIAILVGALFSKTPWHELPNALKGSIFLLSLVTCASMMPVEELPPASWQSAFSLGFISAVFDNIPLTKLALDQGGYDWGVLAYTVGFGGSMIWFGSSAGVAISNTFHKAKSVVFWLKDGWHVIIAYIIGFFVMLYVLGWNPHEPHRKEGAKKKSHHSEMYKTRTDNSQYALVR